MRTETGFYRSSAVRARDPGVRVHDDRLWAVGNRGDVHKEVFFFGASEVSVQFCEGTFWQEFVKRDFTLNDHFCVGRNHDVRVLTLDDLNWLTAQPTS